MTEYSTAIAVFVKTPGLSPIKTRLAADLGRPLADEFYQLAVNAVEATVARAAATVGACPYWAVAEEAGMADPRWRRFERIDQGGGDLGDRLGRVFAELQRRHPVVIVLGADSPQLMPQHIETALDHLACEPGQSAHVLGRCHDGGFYLVGTNVALGPDTWRDVPYGTRVAADRLAAKLAARGEIVELPRRTDVDQIRDLGVLRAEMNSIPNPSREQLAVLQWADEAVFQYRLSTSSPSNR